jgi:N-acetylmuramoyl-L-alanine amidase
LPEPFRIVVDVSSREAPSATLKPGEPRTIKRIVIDPGHGGDDAGAVGPTGLREKDVTLDIAHRVAPILAHELGVETLLTRDADVFVPLDERAARANAFHADLFVSVHCNASQDGEARGVESFVLDPLKEESRANSRIAALENGVKLQKSLDPAEMDAEMAHIYSGLKSGRVGDDSRIFGALLERSVLGSLSERYPDTKEHGVKSAAFYVLAGAEMPAVLFETSFISNPEDESRLATADYREKLADAIANAVRAYREGH